MNGKNSELTSSYQQYLPAILQEDVFVGKFLLAFEKILSGFNETHGTTPETENFLGLEEIIDKIHIYFNPQDTPNEFLPWLAGWVALSLRDDWQEDVKRAFIQEIVRLYKLRGTKAGLEEILRIYLKNAGFGGSNTDSASNVKIFDQFDHFPNYFQVQLTLNDRDPEKYWRQAKIAKAIIDQEKPAQTYYSLKILVPTMQLTKPSQVDFPFKLFAPIPNQTSIGQIELETIVEVTRTNPTTTGSLNKILNLIIVRFKDDFSDFHLFTPETIINNNQIRIKRTLNYQQYAQTIDKSTVTIRNLNDLEIMVKVSVQAALTINQNLSNYKLLEKDNIKLPSTSLQNILRIYRKNEQGENDTILGTTEPQINL
jgi:phage tail-like protein